MRTMIEKERLGRLTKTELIQENKKLQVKMWNLQDIDLYNIDLYNSDVSSDDNFQKDPNFIPPSPGLRKSQSLTIYQEKKTFQKLKMN